MRIQRQHNSRQCWSFCALGLVLGPAGSLIWWLSVCVCRNEKAAPLPSDPSLTRDSSDPVTPSQEPPCSVGTDPHRIMGKEVKEEQNRLKGFTVCSFHSAVILQLYLCALICCLFFFSSFFVWFSCWAEMIKRHQRPFHMFPKALNSVNWCIKLMLCKFIDFTRM